VRSEPELADELGNYEPALDLADSLPNDLLADLPESEPELDPTESSGSLRAWAEFSDDTELLDNTVLEPAPDRALAELDDDDDIEELPPDFLQDWENESPEFSEFVDAPAAPVADSFVAEQPVSLAPTPDDPDFNQPAPAPDAAPSALETELDLLDLDLLDLDTPELESPGLDTLEPVYPDLPQLNLADTDEFEVDQPLPDVDLAELLS
jgi:hypothetical protein